ncbi:MAG: hypothetical protein R3C55_00880 [Parvularculaceae bacterium]
MTATAATALMAGAVAHAADPVEIDISGEASVVAGVSDGDAKADADAIVKVKGSTVLNNGTEVGAVVEGRLDGQQPAQMYAGGRYSGMLIGGPRGVGPLTSDAYVQGAYAYARRLRPGRRWPRPGRRAHARRHLADDLPRHQRQ